MIIIDGGMALSNFQRIGLIQSCHIVGSWQQALCTQGCSANMHDCYLLCTQLSNYST